MEIKIVKLPEQAYSCNSYIIYSNESKKGVIIDPGHTADSTFRAIDELGVKIDKILLTHGHADHILGAKELKEILNAKIYIHRDDAEMINDSQANFSKMMFRDPIEFEADVILEDGDVIKVEEGFEINTIHTPGHTPGGVCYQVGDIIFTGDTIFQSSIGRTDFPGGNFKDIISSIKEKILVFPDDTTLLPGHGENTSVSLEKQYNPFIR